ncbi:hypothetical protein [Rubellimicrobium aerolatum]|uniref:Uncharacterized protein n=1 Tax=Rubellimicrobium aerolatum TaxID=490979 RepID=A0ABW0SEZ2_9RHOB|nr:hypothetical protein [Rubellimicrobium aerolatum]MBP1806480.1 hypothetical protein [Rubellimicrobium aerolatum]
MADGGTPPIRSLAKPLTELERRAALRLIDATTLYLLGWGAELRAQCRGRMRALCDELALVEDDRVLGLRIAAERVIGAIPSDESQHSRDWRLRDVLVQVIHSRAGF